MVRSHQAILSRLSDSQHKSGYTAVLQSFRSNPLAVLEPCGCFAPTLPFAAFVRPKKMFPESLFPALPEALYGAQKTTAPWLMFTQNTDCLRQRV